MKPLNYYEQIIRMKGKSDKLDLRLRLIKSAIAIFHTTLSLRQAITSTPYALQTRGIYVDKNLNVGIGTTSPMGRVFPADGGHGGYPFQKCPPLLLGLSRIQHQNGVSGSTELTVEVLSSFGAGQLVRDEGAVFLWKKYLTLPTKQL